MLYDRTYMKQIFKGNSNGFAVQLIILLSVSFLVVSIISLFSDSFSLLIFENLSFGTSDLGLTIIWRVFTYVLIHDGPFHLLMNILGIYFIGKNLEYQIGKTDFIYLCLISSALGCVFWYAFNSPGQYLLGSSAIVMGCLSTYCLRNPDTPLTLLLFFVLPIQIKPKWVIMGVLCYEIYGFIFNELSGFNEIAHSAHLGGMSAGAFVYFYLQSGRRFPKIVFSGGDSLLSKNITKKHKYFKPSCDDYKINLVDPKITQVEVDRILDKINESGFASLSSKEKKVLDDAKELLK